MDWMPKARRVRNSARNLVNNSQVGDATSRDSLGLVCDAGELVPQDNAETSNCYRLAAEKKNARAQNEPASMNINGEAVPEDQVNTYMRDSLANGRDLTGSGLAQPFVLFLQPLQLALLLRSIPPYCLRHRQ